MKKIFFCIALCSALSIQAQERKIEPVQQQKEWKGFTINPFLTIGLSRNNNDAGPSFTGTNPKAMVALGAQFGYLLN